MSANEKQLYVINSDFPTVNSRIYCHKFLTLSNQMLCYIRNKLCAFKWMFRYEPLHEKTCFMPYVNNKGADQSAHARSLISAFVVHCLDSTIPILAKSKISRLQLASEAEQASLSPTWSHNPKTGFFVTSGSYKSVRSGKPYWLKIASQCHLFYLSVLRFYAWHILLFSAKGDNF